MTPLRDAECPAKAVTLTLWSRSVRVWKEGAVKPMTSIKAAGCTKHPATFILHLAGGIPQSSPCIHYVEGCTRISERPKLLCLGEDLTPEEIAHCLAVHSIVCPGSPEEQEVHADGSWSSEDGP